MAKWKFVLLRRITLEREIYVDVKKCNEITKFLSDARILKTMMNIDSFYLKLVKEFMLTFLKSLMMLGMMSTKKVCVRDQCFAFSPVILNDYLGRGRLITIVCVPYLKTIAKEITRECV